MCLKIINLNMEYKKSGERGIEDVHKNNIKKKDSKEKGAKNHDTKSYI